MAKRWFGVMMGLLLVLAFCGFLFAEGKPEAAKPEMAKPQVTKPAETKAEPAKAPEMKKEAPPKPVMYRMGGKVVAVDPKDNKITIEQSAVKLQRKLALRVGKKEAPELKGIAVGDVVNVWVKDHTITKLVKVF
jgi:hypothetical protein